MKPLENETNSLNPVSSADECAALLADTVPLVMRVMRAQMRSRHSADLSVPQFRALTFISRHPGASLSDLAEHIGLTLPSISKMIDRLVARDLVARHDAPQDRRRTCLELTPLGKATMQSASAAARDHLEEKLAALAPEERAVIIQAMHNLRGVFGAERMVLPDEQGQTP